MASIVALKNDRKSNAALVTMGDVVMVGFLANQIVYPSPNPSIQVFSNHLSLLRNAMSKCGVKGNRGSSRDYINLKAARELVCRDLTQLANYAECTTPGDRTSLSKIGWPLKAIGKKVGKLPPVQNLRQVMNGPLSFGELKIVWDKPLGTKKGQVNSNIIMRSPTSSYAQAKQVGMSSTTSFIDKNPGNGWNYYWVIPFNAFGNGAQSDMCMAYAIPIPA